MGKNPAFQLYPGDWFREPGLQRVDLDIRGAWAEILMTMHDEVPRGVIDTSIAGLARQLRIEVIRACFIVEQLERNRIADVVYFDEESKVFVHACADYVQGVSPDCPEVSPESPYFFTLTNRRMHKEWKYKEYERLKKQKQRESRTITEHVSEMSLSLSSSSSSSSSSTTKQVLKTLATVVDKSTPWPTTLEEVRVFLSTIQAPDEFFNQAYWLRIDQWLGGKDSAVYYFDELKAYLAWCAAQNGHHKHKDMLRGFRNWLSTCSRWKERDAQRKAISGRT